MTLRALLFYFSPLMSFYSSSFFSLGFQFQLCLLADGIGRERGKLTIPNTDRNMRWMLNDLIPWYLADAKFPCYRFDSRPNPWMCLLSASWLNEYRTQRPWQKAAVQVLGRWWTRFLLTAIKKTKATIALSSLSLRLFCTFHSSPGKQLQRISSRNSRR